MSDKLETYIKTNRKQFDDQEPPVDLWHKIENQLNQNNTVVIPYNSQKLTYILSMAATIVIVLSIGLLFLQKSLQKNDPTDIDISQINPHLANQQVHYISLIEAKRSELKNIEKEDPQLYQEFASEIKKMDENYQKLKKDLPQSPNQEETVKAMIRNLQVQIQVLNQQLEIIEHINKLKKGEQHNEKQSI